MYPDLGGSRWSTARCLRLSAQKSMTNTTSASLRVSTPMRCNKGVSPAYAATVARRRILRRTQVGSSMRDHHALLLIAIGMLCACSPRAAPAESSIGKRDCDHPVALLPPGTLISVPHHEVGQRAVTCKGGLARECERQLR